LSILLRYAAFLGVFSASSTFGWLTDSRGGLYVVHGVEVDAAHIVVDQVHNLFGGVKIAGVEKALWDYRCIG
jgi:hypothetical protein